MDLSIIIVNYNTENWLKGCLESIFRYFRDVNLEIIIVDNSSVDESVKFIRENFPQIKLIQNKKNSGFGAANNQGAKIAQGEILFFLNPDTLIKENIFQKIIETFKKDSKIGIIAPQLILPDNSPQPWAYGKEQGIWQLIKSKIYKTFTQLPKYPTAQSSGVDWVSGAALAIRRDIFEKIGGFDEKFFMYFEDRDLCQRVRKIGYKVIVLPEIKVIHFGGRSLAEDKQRKKLYYQSQNYYWQKHYGWFKSILMRLIRWPYKFGARFRLTKS
jgi:GT2 family glycosyltransferase